MKNHAVVFEAEAPVQLRISRKFFLIDLPILEYVSNPFIQLVHALHIALVKFEVCLKSLIGNALQSTQIEFLRFVGLSFCHGDSFSLLRESMMSKRSANELAGRISYWQRNRESIQAGRSGCWS